MVPRGLNKTRSFYEVAMRIVSLFESGRFRQVVSGSEEHVVMPTISAWGGEYFEGEYDDTYWFYGGMPRKRQPCPAVADGLWLHGVRPDSTIYIDGQAYECEEGGDIELSFQYPGTYKVRIERWPYLDGVYEIENTSQAQ